LISLLLAVLVLKTFLTPKDKGDSALILDLKRDITELREKQNAAQKESMAVFNKSGMDLLKATEEKLANVQKTLNEQLGQNQVNLNTRLGQTQNTLLEVNKKLTSLEGQTKNMEDIGRNISSLQNILQPPKLRGNLGEVLLERLLAQIFPKQNYSMQYRFKNGDAVDAVIHLGTSMVPIDSKFPLDDFQRMVSSTDDESKNRFRKEFLKSVKKQIESVAKYIRPDEGTYEFALLYIPAENVFYEAVIKDDNSEEGKSIFELAIEKKVIPVSPNSFYAYLLAIAHGLKGFRIEEKAKEIQKELGTLGKNFNGFFGDFELLGKHLQNAEGKYNDSLKKAEKFQDRLNGLASLEEKPDIKINGGQLLL
jgi:DNA recombination protein RmuC